MASLGMQGSYALQEIDDEVVTRTSVGNYALGYVNEAHLHVQYVVAQILIWPSVQAAFRGKV